MIVIPMAGLSSRFFKAGYSQPKYMLEAHGETLFDHAVKSFEHYFEREKFIFIIRDVLGTLPFVKERITALGINDYHISILTQETQGQAETVALGLADIFNESANQQEAITIFNIDTFRPGFRYPDLSKLGDGYLEVFEGSGDNWSFVKPINDNSTQIIETREKKAISNLCCTGLYHFKHMSDFFAIFNAYIAQPKDTWEKGELYVAPLYNTLIKQGREIHFHLIPANEVIFCGIPQEYDDFKKLTSQSNKVNHHA